MGLLFPKPRPSVLGKRDRKRAEAAVYRKVSADVRRRDGGRCRNCGAVGTETHHLIARSLGGGDEVDNLVTLCAECHRFVTGHALIIHGRHADGPLTFETWKQGD